MPHHGIGVEITINDTRINSRLAKMEYMLSGPAVAGLLQMGVVPLLRADASRRFDSEGRSDGKKWAPLRESTIRRREALGFPAKPINKRTGLLRDYVSTGLGNTTVVGDYSQLAWPGTEPTPGSRLMYSYATAQAGSSRWGTPARPVVNISPRAMGTIYAAIAAHVRTALK